MIAKDANIEITNSDLVVIVVQLLPSFSSPGAHYKPKAATTVLIGTIADKQRTATVTQANPLTAKTRPPRPLPHSREITETILEMTAYQTALLYTKKSGQRVTNLPQLSMGGINMAGVLRVRD